MVIDTSAIVAILQNESEGPGFIRLIATDEVRLLSAVSRVECTCVIEGSKRAAGRADLRRYGRGRHPAGLNIGDTFAYALARATGEPLLFKGNDFPQTDIASAA